MRCNFEITQGICLVQRPHELDLHNNFNFTGLDYSVEHRRLLLRWRRSPGYWVDASNPAALTVEFEDVSEFRFLPRDGAMPFTEDDCMRSFGYWTDEDWADGIIVLEPGQIPEPEWLTGIGFMSGAIIAVKAASAHARIEA
jgi:hypothetical protein